MIGRFATLAIAILMLATPLLQAQEMREVTDAFGQKVQVPVKPLLVVTLSQFDLDRALTLGMPPSVPSMAVVTPPCHVICWIRE